jgi:hypothetical protein
MSTIDLNNLPPNSSYKVSVDSSETNAEQKTRLVKEMLLFCLAILFVSGIYWLAFSAVTNPATPPEEKKWAMSMLSAGASGLIGYLVKR